MPSQVLKPPLNAGIGLLLSVPAAYFLSINVENEVGWADPYELSEPLLLTLGFREGMGFNINLFIAFGPLMALLMNLTSVVSIEWESSKTDMKLNFHLLKKWWNWVTIFIAGPCLLILFCTWWVRIAGNASKFLVCGYVELLTLK